MIKKNVIHIRDLKQASNNGLPFYEIHRVIKFNKKAFKFNKTTQLKPYTEMNSELRTKTKNYFKKYFSS